MVVMHWREMPNALGYQWKDARHDSSPVRIALRGFEASTLKETNFGTP